jgi:hypothetical protein
LYTRPVHEAVEKSEPQLRAIFDFYAATGETDGEPTAQAVPQVSGTSVFARELYLSLDEWFTLLEDAGLLEEQPADPAERRTDIFDRKAAVFCFLWSSPVTTDEVKRRESMQHLGFVDFVEALARVTTFLAMPTAELLKAYGAKSCNHFFLQEAQGTHDGRKLCTRPVDWREKDVASPAAAHALRGPLEMLFSRLIESLSTSGDMLTRNELKARLVARQEAKREAAEARRAENDESTTPRFLVGISDMLVGSARQANMS